MPEVTVAEVTTAEVSGAEATVAEITTAEVTTAEANGRAEVTVAEVTAEAAVAEVTFQDCRVAAPLAQVVGRQGNVVGGRPPRAQQRHKHKHSQCAGHPTHHTNIWSGQTPGLASSC